VRSRTPRGRALALSVAAAVGVAAISGVATATRSAKPPVTRTLRASGTALAFDKRALAAPAGRVRLVLRNGASIRHNISIRGKGLRARRGRVVGKGGVSRVTVRLRPGKYTYFCSVQGHQAAGMRGTLRIRR